MIFLANKQYLLVFYNICEKLKKKIVEEKRNHALYFRRDCKDKCFHKRCHLCIREIIRILSRRRESRVMRETRQGAEKNGSNRRHASC